MKAKDIKNIIFIQMYFFIQYLKMIKVLDFQEHLVVTMMALEDTYFSMGEKCAQNVLIICDRGVMDASAFIDKEAWDRILSKLSLEDIEISDNRYNHIVHMQVELILLVHALNRMQNRPHWSISERCHRC